MAPIVIVGAGVAGLTLAFELTRRGQRVVVLEKDEAPGGLARSFAYGDYTFDIGPHRFHTDVESVNHFIADILGPDQREIRRCSGVYFRGKYYLWPLRLPVLLDLPPSVLLLGLRDLATLRAREVRSFEDYIMNMYGKTLYEVFFRDYSEKFLGIAPSETDAEWARTGMERAIIDKRLKIQKLSDLIISALFTKGTVTRFIYPEQGMTQFCEKLAVRVKGHGGELHCGVGVDRLETEGRAIAAVHAAGRRFPAKAVVWTAPITLAARLLDLPAPDLTYLALVLYNVELSRPPALPQPFQWCYYGQKDIVFNRITVPSAFSPGLTPSGRGSVIVEVTCREADEVWQHPEQLRERVADDLMRTGVVREPQDVTGMHIERVPDAYPVYHLGFGQVVEHTKQALSAYENFHLAGRCGLFWYNNMDNSIEQAQELAGAIA